MIRAKAPGKLYIAGEYAVVEPGQPALLVAVDRYLTVQLEVGQAAADVGRVHSSAYERGPLVWAREKDGGSIVVDHDPRDYVISTLRTVDELRADRGLEPAYFDVRILSELEDADGRKFGLGSSAAVTVAMIAALDELYGLGLTPTERFKLALLATIAVSPRASGGDLAASTFGGWIRYTSPDRVALAEQLRTRGVTATMDAGWEGFSVKPLPEPEGLKLLVGWTGSPASTEILVAGVHHSGHSYEEFLRESRRCVDDLVAALSAGATATAIQVVRRARRVLHTLEQVSGIRIETDMLRDLCEIAERHGGAGKPSGAGGGDCGIVLTSAATSATGILAEWEKVDIRHLGLLVHPPEGGTDAC